MGLKETRELKANAGKPKEKKKYFIKRVSDKTAAKLKETPKPKKKYSIKKISKKVAAAKLEKKESGIVDNSQEIWFSARGEEMTGVCLFCGGKTEYGLSVSIAHLLPKRKNMFPSVAKNPDNWLELCFYGNSCHDNFDTSMISLESLKEQPAIWNVIVEKFNRIYPFIAQKERRNIPSLLLQELKQATH